MTKKEICLNNKSFAYWSWCGWLELKHIEYWINDYVYFITNARYISKWIKYHKAKIYYWEGNYFMCNWYKVRLDECIKM